jgi:hypothetical protein
MMWQMLAGSAAAWEQEVAHLHLPVLFWLQSTAGGADSDVRLVYVSTHAEGVTRVLCFSDSKDQYTRDAYAEDAAGLTRRLAQLEEQLQVRDMPQMTVKM